MFRCDEKRVNWYLNKGLADTIHNNPLSIKLKFTPKGLGNHNKNFGLSDMINRCVNCGTNEYLTRHHVVPLCYRRHFPISIKSHNFHDVLSLCVGCHESYEKKADELKLSLSKQYNAPIGGEIESTNEFKFIKIAKTLIGNSKYIPSSRIKSLKKELKNYYKIKRLTESRLLKISKIKIKTIIKRTHGQIVCEKIDNLQDFIELWRQHFINNNNCKFLPHNWSVKNKI